MNKHVAKLLQPGVFWYCLIMLAFAAAAALFDQYYLAVGELVVTVIVMVVSRLLSVRRRNALMRYVQSATDAEGISVHAGSPFPMAVIRLPEGEIIWGNDGFYAITGLSDSTQYQTLDAVVPGFTTGWLREGRSELPGDQLIGARRYRIYGNYVRSEDDETTVRLATIFFVDMTEMFNVRDEFLRTRPITAVILIDNYDELMSNLPDSTISKLDAQINEAVSGWVTGLHALCRKMERNRYLLLFESKDLSRLQEGKFSILDAIRAVVNPAGVNATISLGIGKDGSSFEENYSFANLSIEMALSRGGDQAVIKNRYSFEFFGGLSEEVEKRTKVKSRVVANALSQLIRDSSQVLVMGHKNSDMDAIGAAAGMVCAARVKNKPVHIVVDREHTMASDLIERLETQSEYKGVFVSAEDAMIMCDFNTLLIVVDVNRPAYVESESLLQSINKVAVIDHHRRAADYIENAVVSLHEPYASSASELVSELLQYLVPTSSILTAEAEAMLSGIYLDTKGFSTRTGVRTFEAAAYLRRAGAEASDVKRLFQSSFDQYMERQKIISSARNCGQGVIFAITGEQVDRIAAAQAADELLSIIGTTASVVAFRSGEHDMAVSARAAGQVNVQLLMERLGGGGNHSAAGAQLRNTTPEEADRLITEAIRGYLEDQCAEKQNER